MPNLVAIALGGAIAIGLEVWRRKTSSPTRPWITCVLDTFCAIPYALKLGPWGKKNDIRTCTKEAYKQLGLKQPESGTSPNEVAFFARYETARNIGLARSKAKFTPFGHYIICESLTKRVLTKLKMLEYVKRHPSITKIPVKNPIFVIGFPRTGTTFLHEMLGLHPTVKMHYTWEQMAPVPETDEETAEALEKDRKARYRNNKGFFDTSLMLAGDAIQRIHRVKYDEPEECTTPCSMELPWAITEIPYIPFSAPEVIPLGAGETFSTYRKFLQLMMWQSSDRFKAEAANPSNPQYPTWMLKCPFHMPYLTELVTEFPDATVVWTHRNPVECIASGCSLYEAMLHMVAEEPSVDKKALGKAVMEYTRLSLVKAEESFASLGAKFRPIHIRYADNVKNSKACCKQIVLAAGLDFSAEFEARIDAYLAKSKAEREALKANKSVANKSKGTQAALHEYTLEEYGLSEEMVRREFKDYIDKYQL